MINTKHLFKVASAWISAVYVVCYAGVAIYPPIRGLFMRYSLHTDVFFKSDFFQFQVLLVRFDYLEYCNRGECLAFYLFV